MKKIISNKDKSEPDYMPGGLDMERLINHKRPAVNLLSRFRTEIEGMAKQNGNSRNGESQTSDITRRVMSACESSNIEDFLPDLSDSEIAARARKMVVAPMKAVNDKNPFGGIWNEMTCMLAARRLGMPTKNLDHLIDSRSPIGERLRKTQANISIDIEREISSEIISNRPTEIFRLVRTMTWAEQLIAESKRFIKARKMDLPKQEETQIIGNAIETLIEVINFSPNQELPATNILSMLIDAQLDKPINIINLQCMNFVNDAVKGICVSPTAEDMEICDADGKRMLISQSDAIDKVNEFAEILSKRNIKFNVSFLVFDNDKIVLPGQEKNVILFLSSFENFLQQNTKFEAKIIRASDVINPDDSEPLWQRFKTSREKLLEKLVDDEFQRLQAKTLPPSQKTRDFAREVAHKLFLIQTSTGKVIPSLFDPTIILQRTKAQQQSSELFKIGASMTKTKAPILIAHWKDRKTV